MSAPESIELQTLIHHLPYFVVVVDSDAKFVWTNRLDPTLRAEDVIGKPFDTFTSPEQRPECRAIVERCLRTQEPGYYEARGYGEGEFATWYGCRVVSLPPNADGQPRAMILSADVTARRRAQEQLARSEARFRSLVETTPDFICIVDSDRRMLYLNREPPARSAVSRDQVLGRRIEELVHEDDRAKSVAVLSSVLETGKPGSYAARGAYARGHYEIDVARLPDTAGKAAEALVVARDVTAAWNAAQQRERMLAELDHRVKNTLAMILAMAEQTMARTSSFETFRETFSGRLKSLARTHEALAASRWSSVSLAEVIRLTVGALSGGSVGLPEEAHNPLLPPEVVTPLSLALHELTTNAIKYGGLSTHNGAGLKVQSTSEPGVDLVVDWTERLKHAAETSAEGLGLRLVRGLITSELGGTFDVQLNGLERRYRLRISLGDRE